VTLTAVQGMEMVAWRRGARPGLVVACWLAAPKLIDGWEAGFMLVRDPVLVALMADPEMMVVGWRRGACLGLMLACNIGAW